VILEDRQKEERCGLGVRGAEEGGWELDKIHLLYYYWEYDPKIGTTKCDYELGAMAESGAGVGAEAIWENDASEELASIMGSKREEGGVSKL
jgi:hypothetical protein